MCRYKIGSPPHTWRIPVYGYQLGDKNGITSTYVENTIGIRTDESYDRDHLHIRGEYQEISPLAKRDLGSPPHTWRIQIYSFLTLLTVRITSTYVENTIPHVPILQRIWDHLHIRGEYTFNDGSESKTRGSPPHTWRILCDFIIA